VAATDPKLRKELLKSARLWALSAICALVGAIVISTTDSIGFGVLAFLGALIVLGPILMIYERRHR
jgi:hypothetical protein